ncbi:MAG TPA: response regulator transcription factor [Candidatus Rubrimentiphilum sp.]|nr:response regulator transcription factor [Candidatus Rubrimentiphilum sp.]
MNNGGPSGAGKRILIVDDEAQIGEVLSAYLQQESFEVVVCQTVATALAELERQRPDMMILDITLPDGSGLDILRRGVKSHRIPTIMLTARSDEVDRVVGLELGADDYIVKPFSPREVVARVRAVMRRVDREAEDTSQALRVKDLEIDEGAHEVRVAGSVVPITPAEFRILQVLAQNAGHVLTRAQLLDLVHDDGSIFERTLDRHINNLRRKIEPNPEDPVYVVTVYGVGYKLRKD